MDWNNHNSMKPPMDWSAHTPSPTRKSKKLNLNGTEETLDMYKAGELACGRWCSAKNFVSICCIGLGLVGVLFIRLLVGFVERKRPRPQ